MPPTRVPTPSDLTSLPYPVALHPHPTTTTTTLLLCLHGLGDSHTNFSTFPRSLSLPFVTSLTPRGTTPLPTSLLTSTSLPTGSPGYFHWGDDIHLSPTTGLLSPDPGFTQAVSTLWESLIKGILLDTCGWSTRDIILFGFGQGGSLALALALHTETLARTLQDPAVVPKVDRFRGVVTLGGPVPGSAVGASEVEGKARSSVLAVQVDEEEEEEIEEVFSNVRVVRWKRKEVGMPASREEMLPIMQYFAEILRLGY